MADLTLVEPKTQKADLYPRLDVEEPGKGKSTQVSVKDKSGATLAELIVGKRRSDRLGAGNDCVYLRKADNPQAWLAPRPHATYPAVSRLLDREKEGWL